MPFSKKIHILVIDDEKEFTDLLLTRLKTQNLAIEVAQDLKQAIQLIHNRLPDVLLLNLDLSGLSGIEILRRIRRQYPVLPVITLAQQKESESEKEAQQLGISDSFVKPVIMNDLAEAIKQAYRNKLDNSMTAITFAEGGSFDTAKEIMGYEPLPEELLSPTETKARVLYAKSKSTSDHIAKEISEIDPDIEITNTQDLISKINEIQPNVVIIEIINPNNWAQEMLTKIKEKNSNSEVIIVTENLDLELASLYFNKGLFDYIIKPIDPDKLHLRIKDAAKQSNLLERKAYLANEGLQ